MILIFEGIYVFNFELIFYIFVENKYKIYVLVLIIILLDNYNYILIIDNCLLCCIICDYKYCGYFVEEIIRRWFSVCVGEEKWIFLYQENVDVMFNFVLLFELVIMKDYVIFILRNVFNNKLEYLEVYCLCKFLEYFVLV